MVGIITNGFYGGFRAFGQLANFDGHHNVSRLNPNVTVILCPVKTQCAAWVDCCLRGPHAAKLGLSPN